MIKLAVFDLDGTLAPLGKGISREDIRLLREIEQRGVRVALCSGKPCYYLCGLVRQVGLERPILIGENGAVIVFGVELPPKRRYVLPCSEAAKSSIAFLKNEIGKLFPDIWYQPNEVALTPFPVTERQFDAIQAVIDENRGLLSEVTVYRHVDSFDILPLGIDKKSGLAYLAERIGVSPREIVAVGDGVNDYPMFEYAAYSLGVNVADETRVQRNFASVTKALRYILEITR